MDPLTLLTIADIGLTLFGGLKQSEAEQASGKSKQEYYNVLARETEKESMLIGDTAARASAAFREKSLAEAGTQRSAVAASGASLESVSAEDVAYASLSSQMKDEMAIRYQAEMAQLEKRIQAEGYRRGGAEAEAAGRQQAFTSLISTASRVGSKFIPNRLSI